VTLVLICSHDRDGELLRRGQKKTKKTSGSYCEVSGRSSDDGREHFRRQFIWPVGTIKLFPQNHVKNNTAESILLEQRDYVRHPVDIARHGATDDLRGEMKGNRLPRKLKLPLTAFVVYSRLAIKLELQGETVVTSTDIKVA